VTERMLCLRLHDGPGRIAGSRHVAWEVTDDVTSHANGSIEVAASLGPSLRDKLRWYVEEFPNAPFAWCMTGAATWLSRAQTDESRHGSTAPHSAAHLALQL
jgi:hypothetical protein